MLSLGFGWAAFAIIFLILFVFCFFIVRYYTDRHEAEALPTIVTVAALTLSLLALFLIPIDILSVSQNDYKAASGTDVKTLYYILYSSILAFAFVIIPFSYFYYEEFDEDVTVKQRIFGGVKYTVFLLLIVVVLLIIGLFIKPSTNIPNKNNTSVEAWAKYLSDSDNKGEGALTFAVACLTILGYGIWFTYTAYGLTAFPIGLLKGKRHHAEEASDIQSDLEATREQKRAISSKYMTGKKMNAKDERQLDLLKRQEKILANRSARIDASQKGFAKVMHVCKPFVFVFGIAFALVTLLIFVSIILSLIDKVVNTCGVKCGFFSNYPKIPNPIDLLLFNLAPYFPLDYVVFGSLIAYIFFCTLSGIVRIGVRFLWVHLYNIKPRQTPPQGLLLTAIILMLALLVLNIEMLTIAPRYTSYGTQANYLGNGTTCDPTHCNITQIAGFVGRIELGTPFFGNVYFYAMWIFVVTFIIGLIVAIVKRKESNLEDEESDDDN